MEKENIVVQREMEEKEKTAVQREEEEKEPEEEKQETAVAAEQRAQDGKLTPDTWLGKSQEGEPLQENDSRQLSVEANFENVNSIERNGLKRKVEKYKRN